MSERNYANQFDHETVEMLNRLPEAVQQEIDRIVRDYIFDVFRTATAHDRLMNDKKAEMYEAVTMTVDKYIDADTAPSDTTNGGGE